MEILIFIIFFCVLRKNPLRRKVIKKKNQSLFYRINYYTRCTLCRQPAFFSTGSNYVTRKYDRRGVFFRLTSGRRGAARLGATRSHSHSFPKGFPQISKSCVGSEEYNNYYRCSRTPTRFSAVVSPFTRAHFVLLLPVVM